VGSKATLGTTLRGERRRGLAPTAPSSEPPGAPEPVPAVLAEEQRAAQYRQAINEEAERRGQVEIEVWGSFNKRVKPIPEANPNHKTK